VFLKNMKYVSQPRKLQSGVKQSSSALRKTENLFDQHMQLRGVIPKMFDYEMLSASTSSNRNGNGTASATTSFNKMLSLSSG